MARTYCIEVDWEECGQDIGEPSVKHLLQMIDGWHGVGYIHHVAATMCEMRHWLDKLSKLTPTECSILYFATHGSPGWISLPDQNSVRLSDMPERFPKDFARQRLVHFSGCNVLRTDKQDKDCGVSNADLDEFLDRTGAYAVSGFTEEVGWAEDTGLEDCSPPGVALEFMYLSSIRALEIKFAGRNPDSEDSLRPLARRLQGRFKDCGFRLRTRRDRNTA